MSSHSSSVLAANDCRVVLTFLQRSPSFLLASASRVQHDNESWHARQRAYLTNTSNLNSYDSRTRAWADVFMQKNVPQRCSSIAFDYFDLSQSNLLTGTLFLTKQMSLLHLHSSKHLLPPPPPPPPSISFTPRHLFFISPFTLAVLLGYWARVENNNNWGEPQASPTVTC